MRNRLLYFLLLLLLNIGMIPAQSVSVKAKIDSTQMWIGSQTALKFEVIQSPKQRVKLPIFSDTIVNALEIVEQQKLDTIHLSSDKIQVNAHYTVTSFYDSLIYIPPFSFITDNDTILSNSLSLKVIQPFKIDTTSNAIADIKPVMKPKFNWGQFIKNTLLILLVIVLFVILFIIIRKFMGKKSLFSNDKSVVKLPAHIEALAKLDKIKNEKLWQHGRIKEYHTELTDVIRTYIEEVFSINSLEMTSGEILDKTLFLKMDKPAAYECLKNILSLADLVKFAKYKPSINKNELSLVDAYLFVNQTKVDEIKLSEAPKVSSDNSNTNED